MNIKITELGLEHTSRVNTEIENIKNTWASVLGANAAKFARTFYNLESDLKAINPIYALSLFGDSDLHTAMCDAVLEARAVVDPQHYGDTRQRMDQIVATGDGKQGILNPLVQREMTEYVCHTLLSNQALESLALLRETLTNLSEEIATGTHHTLIQNIISFIDRFVNTARSLQVAPDADFSLGNPASVRAYVDRTVQAVLASDYVEPERKGALLQSMAIADQANPFAGLGNAMMDLLNETYKLSLAQLFCMEPINGVLNELVDALALIDNDVYYPIIQSQDS
ncbi:MAG: hypothetical protein LBJ94_02540 [Puniceicoccales bacterium]|jgi:hypothetical protein|nr:hypothetical protein [Puniceicoccales bacterium]